MIPIPAALGPIALAIKALYQMGDAVSDFLDRHIADLKQSDNPTIASTGRVLEAAKYGFGIGYMSSIAIIAAGQMLLGNPLSSAATLASGVTLTHPVAMTCAAIGAIYYGWQALSGQERDAVLSRLAAGLAMGAELIRSLLDFVIRKSKDFLSDRQLADFKTFVRKQAGQFGKSMYDITQAMGDLMKDTAEKAGTLAGHAAGMTSSASKMALELASEAADKASDAASGVARTVRKKLPGTRKKH